MPRIAYNPYGTGSPYGTNSPSAFFQPPTNPTFMSDIIARMMGFTNHGYTGSNGLYINPDGTISWDDAAYTPPTNPGGPTQTLPPDPTIESMGVANPGNTYPYGSRPNPVIDPPDPTMGSVGVDNPLNRGNGQIGAGRGVYGPGGMFPGSTPVRPTSQPFMPGGPSLTTMAQGVQPYTQANTAAMTVNPYGTSTVPSQGRPQISDSSFNDDPYSLPSMALGNNAARRGNSGQSIGAFQRPNPKGYYGY
jgi:hypothetical protein